MKQLFAIRIFAFLLMSFAASLIFLSPAFVKAQTAIPDRTIDKPMKDATVQEIVKLVKENYVFQDVADKVAADLEQRAKNGEYDRITSAKEFADLLTDNLRAVGHDKHLYVRLTNSSNANPFTPETIRAMNYGILKAEVLPNNIGYLKINVFPPPNLVEETLAAGMNFLKNTDALIIDLRDHRGGAVPTVAMNVSYFVPEKALQLLAVDSPRTDLKRESWTLEKVAGPRYLNKPVYLLISSKTFSGGEEFAYDMQALKRATLIGETTAGGANPVRLYPVQNMFSVGVPNAQVKSVITGKNWEGVGVKPDVEIPADQSLQKAQEIALKQLQEGKGNASAAENTVPPAQPQAPPMSAKDASFKLPETPAGKVLNLFLAALNSGDLEKIKKFHSSFDAPDAVNENSEKDYQFYQNSKGLEPLKIAASSDYSITVTAKLKSSDRWLNFTMDVEAAEPHRIAGIKIQSSSKPAN